MRFRALIERFQHIVRFGLAGHTHLETYQVHNSMSDPMKPVFVTSVVGAVTTYAQGNPSFQVLDIDTETLLPTNKYTYYTDVEKLDETGNITWSMLHDYKETYSMNDMSPSSFKDLAVRILLDPKIATIFKDNIKRQNSNADDDLDQLFIFCDLATSESHEKNKCL